MQFNYHADINHGEDAVARIRELLGRWREASNESQTGWWDSILGRCGLWKDTVPTTPFPVIGAGVTNRLTGYEPCTFLGDTSSYDMAVTVGYPDEDFGPKAAQYIYGLNARLTTVPVLQLPVYSSTALAALPCGSVKVLGQPTAIYDGCVRKESVAATPTLHGETVDCDPDFVSKVRYKALSHTRRELFSVHASSEMWPSPVSAPNALATEVDETSRSVCLKGSGTGPGPHDCGHVDVNLFQGECGGKTQPERVIGEDYPVANFYKPTGYEWTTEGYEAREALKRFSEPHQCQSLSWAIDDAPLTQGDQPSGGYALSTFR